MTVYRPTSIFRPTSNSITTMKRSLATILALSLMAICTAGAITLPVALSDALRIPASTVVRSYNSVRLKVPAELFSWSETARFFDSPTPHSPLPTPNSAIRFTRNCGQIADTDGKPRPEILYTADAQGARLYFTSRGVSFAFTRAEQYMKPISEAAGKPFADFEDREDLPATVAVYRMDMLFEGANPFPRVKAEEELQGYSNYYLAHCPDGVIYVKSYGRLIYEDIYENIDLVYRVSQGRLKYEFVVRPGGDASDIRLRYDGASAIIEDRKGGLEIRTPLGSINEDAPYTFQGDVEVASAFVAEGGSVRFEIGSYDAAMPLVIDPWATFCGGSAWDMFLDVVCDGAGNVYAEGQTESQNFPIVNGYQTSIGGGSDIMVVKYSPGGSLVWSTYYGGSGEDCMSWGPPLGTDAKMAVDGSGNSYIATITKSSNFPVSMNAFQSIYGGGDGDCAMVILNSSGLRQWATYYGGSGYDLALAITVDANGNFVFTGLTRSADFPLLNAYQTTLATPGADAFIVKFNFQYQRSWSTYLGGSGDDVVFDAAIDAVGNIFVGGQGGPGFPTTPGCFQPTYAGYYDAFICKFSDTGSLQWSTLYGGSSLDQCVAICLDASGDVYAAGVTYSSNFPVLNGYQNTFQGGANDCFIIKFSSRGFRYFGSFFGGSASDEACSIEVDGTGHIYVAGYTESWNLPILNGYQAALGGNKDGFAARFTPTLQLTGSTYCGGNADDIAMGLALGQSGDVVLGGGTGSSNFPVLNGQQMTYGGSGDGFISVYAANGFFPVELTSFHAVAIISSGIQLEWKTACEANNAGFIIERKLHGERELWERRGFVPGAGNSSAAREYSFTDELPPGITSDMRIFYRLRQVDADGSETVSPEVVVTGGSEASGVVALSVYPNPAAPLSIVHLQLPVDQELRIELCDGIGRRVRRLHPPAAYKAGLLSLPVDLAGLPPGSYYLRAEGEKCRACARVQIR